MENSGRVTVTEAARHFGIGESTLWRRVKKGILKRDENNLVSPSGCGESTSRPTARRGAT